MPLPNKPNYIRDLSVGLWNYLQLTAFARQDRTEVARADAAE